MEELLNRYDAILFINRNEDTDRCNNILNQFNNAIRIEAITPSKQIDDIINSNDGDEPYHIRTITPQKRKEVCCSLSHAKAWEYAISNKLNRVLILEDDAQLINIININTPNNALITYLSYLVFTENCGEMLLNNGYTINAYKRNDDCCKIEGGIFSSIAYELNTTLDINYNDIINKLKQGVIMDYFMSSYIQCHFNCYMPLERLIMPNNEFKSTIGDDYIAIVESYENKIDRYVYGCEGYDETSIYLPKKSVSSCYVTYLDGGKLYTTPISLSRIRLFKKFLELNGDYSYITLTYYDVLSTDFFKNVNNGRKEYLYRNENGRCAKYDIDLFINR